MEPSISLERLAHKVPKPARKEYDRARSERDKRRLAEAEAHYQKSLELDPEFVEAANDLGALTIPKAGTSTRCRSPSGRARSIQTARPPWLT